MGTWILVAPTFHGYLKNLDGLQKAGLDKFRGAQDSACKITYDEVLVKEAL